MGLNFIFTILYLLLDQRLDELINRFDPNSGEYAPLMLIYYLFGTIVSAPFINMEWAIADPILNSEMDYLFLGLGYLVSPIIAAILAGRLGESKGQCFGGWLLTVVVSTVCVLIGTFLSPTTQNTLDSTYGWTTNDIIIIYALITCVINLIFYGFFALLVSKSEIY